tara:strand:- start:640 stop:1089 length:450 start_codon:yes stop_codon:yes gene_type:complete
MIRYLVIFFASIFFSPKLIAQNILKEQDKNSIISVLEKQEMDWNSGDINAFMQGYIKSDELVFNGSNGPFYGWKSVKDRYLNSYPTKQKMGKLNFKILKISSVTENVAQVLGKYFLNYPDKQLSGYFSLIWLKTKNGWLILSDHTSSSN